MADAMNRSIPSIIAGGFGGGGAIEGGDGRRRARRHGALDERRRRRDPARLRPPVVIVPGYGMAVAQAQHAVREMAKRAREAGVRSGTRSTRSPGRMPGHMNVLLAEADVPYEQLKEMDEINPEFPRTDVSLVIGANDVTNPAASTNPESPIYGMPILNVNESRR